MCFYINGQYPNPMIATKDIGCYKVGYRATMSNVEVFKSKCRGYTYQLNSKQPEIQLNPHYDDIAQGLNVIREGYHSYSNLTMANINALSDQVIVKCIIPKGSTYYLNTEWHEYVSSSLIVTNFLTN